MTIRIKDQTGEETYFKVKKTTRTEKVFAAYSQRKGVSRLALRFLLDGQRLDEPMLHIDEATLLSTPGINHRADYDDEDRERLPPQHQAQMHANYLARMRYEYACIHGTMNVSTCNLEDQDQIDCLLVQMGD